MRQDIMTITSKASTLLLGEEQKATESVVAIVQKYLARQPLDGAHIEVVKGTRWEGDWWYIPVRLTGQLARPSHYFDALAETEIDLKDNEQLEVLFVPSA